MSKSQTQELELVGKEQALAVAPTPTPSDMLQAIVKGGITPENVTVFEKALDICYRMEQRNAEKAFAAAFVALQSEMPTIVAKTIIPNRGKYEKFEDVMEVVGPLLAKHGFSVCFSQDFKEARITVICNLMHIGGHRRENPYTTRVSGKADSETQADSKASTTAKRNSLLQALNIVIRQDFLQDEDDDPRNEGTLITPAQAEELQRRVIDTESNELAFLKLAGINAISGQPNLSHYKAIMSNKYSMLDEMLQKKESRGR